MKINYTVAECPLGLLLVAVTDKGICSVTLGDEGEELTGGLRAEFPQAEIARDEKRLQTQVRALLAHLAGQEPHPDLPLDVQGTAFQKRVWEELRRIPYGQTASYGDVARRIGRPSATRAGATRSYPPRPSRSPAVSAPCFPTPAAKWPGPGAGPSRRPPTASPSSGASPISRTCFSPSAMGAMASPTASSRRR